MFGALNRFIGRLDSDSQGQLQNNDRGDGSYGFQVLRSKDPELPLEPWFDFIVGINGRLIVRTPRFHLEDSPPLNTHTFWFRRKTQIQAFS